MLRHSIRKETLTVEVASHELAWSVQPKLRDLNQSHFFPVFERVLDEFAAPGRDIKIPALNLELGQLPSEGFEVLAAERLELELRAALTEVVARAGIDGDSPYKSQSEDEHQASLVEHYLRFGKLPFWAPPASSFSLEGALLQMLERDSAGVIRLIHKLANRPWAIQRLILQMSESDLIWLLNLLEPEYAVLILSYMLDLRDVQRETMVPAVPENRFARLLWFLVFAYLLQDPGSQFNRKSFVRYLLQGIAEQEALNFQDLLFSLQLALARVEKKRPPKSSLPTILSELVREEQIAGSGLASDRGSDEAQEEPLFSATAISDLERSTFSQEASLNSLACYLTESGGSSDISYSEVIDVKSRAYFPDGQPPDIQLERLKQVLGGIPDLEAAPSVVLERVVSYLAEINPRALVQMIRHYAPRSSRLERIAFQFPERLLRRLVQLLEPVHAAVVITFLVGFREAHQQEGILPLPREQFERVLWLLTLEYLVHDRGSQFNRKSFVSHTLRGIAQREGVDLLEVLKAAHRSLQSVEKLRPVRFSLPGILAELIHEHEVHGPGGAAAALSAQQLVEHEDAGVADSFAGYDRVYLLQYYLRHGMLPWNLVLRNPELKLEPALALLPTLPRSLVCAILMPPADKKQQHELVLRAVRMMTEDRILAFISGMLPQGASAENAFLTALSAFAAEIAETEPRQAFYSLVLAAILRGEALDLEELSKASSGCIAAGRMAFPRDLLLWEAHALKSAIVSRLRQDNIPQLREFDVKALHRALLEKYPAEARQLLDAIGADSHLHAAFTELMQDLALSPAPTASSAHGDLSRSRVEEASSPDARQAVLAFLAGNERPLADTAALQSDAGEVAPDSLLYALVHEFDEPSHALYDVIARHIAGRRSRERWVATLPETALVRIASVLLPGNHGILLDTLEVLHSALLHVLPAFSSVISRRNVWLFFLGLLGEKLHGEAEGVSLSVEHLAAHFLSHFSEACRQDISEPSGHEAAGMALIEHARRLASEKGLVVVSTILLDYAPALGAAWQTHTASVFGPSSRRLKKSTAQSNKGRKSPARAIHGRTAFGLQQGEESLPVGEPIYIDNAGLVLTAPFLPHLFGSLNMLRQDENGKTHWLNDETASRGVHLLQYLVEQRTNAPEPLLVLNKLLCGLAVVSRVERSIMPTVEELATCHRLLQSMLVNWKTIAGTSVAGMRETFLQRPGRLEQSDSGWKLRVQRKTLDVLVDQVPWSFAVIFHQWMSHPLHVTW